MVVELLVKAVDATNPDPEKDRVSCYKAGFIVDVKPDGHKWGRQESLQQWLAEGLPRADWPGNFFIIRMTGLPIEKAKALLDEQVEDDSGTLLFDFLPEAGPKPKIFRCIRSSVWRRKSKTTLRSFMS